MNQELRVVQAEFRKGNRSLEEETEIKKPHSLDRRETTGILEKHLLLLH